MARDKGVIWVGREEGIFLQAGLDQPNQLDPSWKFTRWRERNYGNYAITVTVHLIFNS
jgi:hypothetical protein